MSSCFIISDVVSEYPNFKADLGFQNLPTRSSAWGLTLAPVLLAE